MKRSVVGIGFLGLVYALARPAAAQTVLQKFDMSDDSILKDSQTYVQGFGSNISNDSTLKPWYVLNGWLTNDDPSGATTGADGSGQIDAIDGAIKFELLTGDKTWTDYSFQVKMHSGAQNTGGAGIIVRAQPKTKPSDPDTYYELHYITANSTEGPGNTTDETILPDEAKSGIAPSDDVPALRLEKVVNNKYSILAETSFSKTTNHIPEVNAAGPDNENGAIFRVVVKGSLIQVFTSLDGTTFQKSAVSLSAAAQRRIDPPRRSSGAPRPSGKRRRVQRITAERLATAPSLSALPVSTFSSSRLAPLSGVGPSAGTAFPGLPLLRG